MKNCQIVCGPACERPLCTLFSKAGRDAGPALLDVLAVAVRANKLSFLVVDHGENPIEVFLAIETEEFAVRHKSLLLRVRLQEL